MPLFTPLFCSFHYALVTVASLPRSLCRGVRVRPVSGTHARLSRPGRAAHCTHACACRFRPCMHSCGTLTTDDGAIAPYYGNCKKKISVQTRVGVNEHSVCYVYFWFVNSYLETGPAANTNTGGPSMSDARRGAQELLSSLASGLRTSDLLTTLFPPPPQPSG